MKGGTQHYILLFFLYKIIKEHDEYYACIYAASFFYLSLSSVSYIHTTRYFSKSKSQFWLSIQIQSLSLAQKDHQHISTHYWKSDCAISFRTSVIGSSIIGDVETCCDFRPTMKFQLGRRCSVLHSRRVFKSIATYHIWALEIAQLSSATGFSHGPPVETRTSIEIFQKCLVLVKWFNKLFTDPALL